MVALCWLVILVLGLVILLLQGDKPDWLWSAEVTALLVTGLLATLLFRFMLHKRRKAEQALAESEDRFSSLAANVPGIIFRCSTAEGGWEILFISDAVELLTGRFAEDFTQTRSRPLAPVIHPEDKERSEEPFWKQAIKGEDYSLEYRIIRRDGQIRWMMERGRGVLDGRGMFKWVDGAIFDVTERKLAEVEQLEHVRLLENLERVDQAIRTAHDLDSMMSAVLETTRLIFGSDRAWLLYPCDPEAPDWGVPMERSSKEFPGAGELDVRFPMTPEVTRALANALEADGPVPYDTLSELKVPASMQEQFSVKAQLVMALYPRTGKPWLFGIHQCTHPRVWFEEEQLLFREIGRRLSDALTSLLTHRILQESEIKFRTFAEQTMLGVGVIQNDRFRYLNKALADMFEYDVNTALSWKPGEYAKVIHPEDRAFVMEQARRKQHGDKEVVGNYVFRGLTSGGEPRWMEIHSQTIDYEGENALLMSLTDITSRKEVQDELAELNRGLENIVAERTRDLRVKAEELEAANERLMRLDEMKSALVTTVAHDLRTPLTSVLGFAKIMKRDFNRSFGPLAKGDDKLARKAKRIVSNLEIIAGEGARLSRLMDDFLDLSKIESGRVEWRDTDVSVSACLERAMFNIGRRLASKPGVRVKSAIAEALPTLYMDRGRLEQVLTHLLDNAVKFTEEGDIQVRISSRDGIMRIEVEDPGVGIPVEEQKNIFDTFHQVGTGDTLQDTLKGTGLGLTISKQIVNHYNGTISVFSEGEKGSRFVVELPLGGAG